MFQQDYVGVYIASSERSPKANRSCGKYESNPYKNSQITDNKNKNKQKLNTSGAKTCI